MKNFKIGDRVSVLHETTVGVVTDIDKQQVKIEDTDGFERVYSPTDLVLVASKKDYSFIHHKDKPEDVLPKSDRLTPTAKKNNREIPEIDLHIDMLVDDCAGLTNFEIVQKQLFACKRFLQSLMHGTEKKAILIHGKGTGVLRHEVLSYLEKLKVEEGVELIYYDANFQRYGIGGATEVHWR